MKRILVCLTNSNDACSWYRGIGPWSEIHRRRQAEVWFSARPSWQDVRAVDAVYMLRPCTKELIEGAQAAHDFGRPLIVDYDDDLLGLPKDNPSYSLFALPEIQSNVKQFLAAATAVLSSTDALAEKLRERNPNVYTIRNAFDHHLMKFWTDKPCNKSVIWRGTATHHRDVAGVADQIVEVAARHPEFLFVFMGNDPAPWACSEKIKNVMRVNKLDLMNYFKSISALRPRVVIAPLADSKFNRGKSNIAAIEAAYAGAPCIAPDWPEWSMPGSISYGANASFGDCLERALTDDAFRQERAENSWASVQNYYSLEAANLKRLELIDSLVGHI